MDIVSLDAPGATEPARVGGKAATLARLRCEGFTIPPGFVIGVSVFQRFLHSAGLTSHLDTLATTTNSETLTQSLREATAAMDATSWPSSLESAVTAAYASIGPPLIVSSQAERKAWSPGCASGNVPQSRTFKRMPPSEGGRVGA